MTSIEVKNLCAYFPTAQGEVKAADGITASFSPNAFTAVVGESGCGKSVLGQAILGILPSYVKTSGEVNFMGHNLLEALPENFYGGIMGVVPQNPSESLNPIRTVKKQMLDALGRTDEAALDLLIEKLAFFGLNDFERVLSSYPHELSGGMQQRVLCAMAFLKSPKWILADEPTKGLDEVTASVVYENLAKIKAAKNCGMIMITHDITLARTICDKAAVMYAGELLEYGDEVFSSPKHPYTKAFVAALPENGFVPLEGMAPSPRDNVSGCKFASRCSSCMQRCRTQRPDEYEVDGAKLRCFLYA